MKEGAIVIEVLVETPIRVFSFTSALKPYVRCVGLHYFYGVVTMVALSISAACNRAQTGH